jgi:hypothetical protein
MIPLVVFFAYFVALMVVNRWVGLAQSDYLALYLERAPASPTRLKLEQMERSQTGLRALLSVPGWSAAAMKAMTKPQPDPVLEEARRRYIVRRRAAFIVFVVGFFASFAAATLAR